MPLHSLKVPTDKDKINNYFVKKNNNNNSQCHSNLHDKPHHMNLPKTCETVINNQIILSNRSPS